MPLVSDRNTPRREGDLRRQALAASVVVFAGAILMRNATGYLTKGQTALNLVGVGVAMEGKTGGANPGEATITWRAGIHRFKNSAAADAITIAEIGKPCFVVDDETVAKTNGTNTRSIAGFVEDVDAQGVWVEFDEQRVQSHLAGTA